MIYCLMHSGKNLSAPAREVLLENAQWMRYEGRRKWRIKHPLCDGVIESDLEIIDYLGLGVVQFKALVETPDGITDVTYVVRIADLDNFNLAKMKWAEEMKNVPREVEDAIGRVIAEVMDREGMNPEEYHAEVQGISVNGRVDEDTPLAVFTTDEDDEEPNPFSSN